MYCATYIPDTFVGRLWYTVAVHVMYTPTCSQFELFSNRVVLVSRRWYLLAQCGSLRVERLKYIQHKREKYLRSKVNLHVMMKGEQEILY